MAAEAPGRLLAAGFLAGLVAVGGVGIVSHAIHAGSLPALPPRPTAPRPVAPAMGVALPAELMPAALVEARPAAVEAGATEAIPTVLLAAPPSAAPRSDDAAPPVPAPFPGDGLEPRSIDPPTTSLPLRAAAALVLVQFAAADGDGEPRPATEPRGLPAGERAPDADAIEWSEAATGDVPPLDAAGGQRRGPVAAWIRDSFEEMRGARGGVVPFPQRQAASNGRLIDRIRSGERILGRDRGDKGRETAAASRAWPNPAALLQQLDQLAKGEPPASASWGASTAVVLRSALATAGPADAEAAAVLAELHGCVDAGLGLASRTADPIEAAALRRLVLAVQRRSAVWGDAAALARAVAAEPPTQLLETLERYETAPLPADAAWITDSLARLEESGTAEGAALARSVREHYAAANVRVAVHRKFVERVLPPTEVTSAPVDDTVLGRQVRGTSRVARSTDVRFTPDDDGISVVLEVRGQVASRTVTESGPVALTSRGNSSFTVHKPLTVGDEGLVVGRAVGSASSRSQLADIQTSFDGVPIMRSLVRSIARNQHDENLPEANREVIDKIVARACREVDQQVGPRLEEAAERLRTQAWGPLERLGLEPTPVALESTDGIAMARLRLAAGDQLAAFTPRPRAPLGSMLSVQVHESAVNNALDRLGLAGRTLSLEELVTLLCQRAGVEPSLPDELPEDVTVGFAAVQPLRVQCRDGLVHVRVALETLESGRRTWSDLVVGVTYRPKAEGPQVFLEREGPVQIGGPGRQGRAEIALRAVFGKIFPKERPLPLVPESFTADPELAELDVLQAVSADGWLAVSLGELPAAKPPAPAKVAAPTAKRRGLRR
ncbi:MAG: hypothetical protein ACKO5R_02185 [Planctomycetaceae bacterium]